MKLAALALSLLTFTAACDKGENSPGSTALPASNLELLRDLPGGNFALFGGNYMRMQDFMQTAFGSLAADMMQKQTDGGTGSFKKWMECFTSVKKLELAGAAAFQGSSMAIRIAMRGMKIDEVKTCADRAAFTSTVDPDGKYIAITMTINGAPLSYGYLALPDGALYSRQSMVGAVATPASRADLEADVAKTTSSSAANDQALIALAGKVDRKQTVWIVASGAGTPMASKLGDVRATISLEGGLGLDTTFQLVDENMAKQLDEGVATARKQAAQLPPAVKSILDSLTLSRDGGRIHAVLRLTEAQVTSLASLASQLGALGPR